MEEARSQGGLRTNSFITMHKLFVVGQPLIEIDEVGNSETVLTNGRLLRGMAQQLLKNGSTVSGLPRRTVRLIQCKRADAGAVSIRHYRISGA